MVKSFSGFSEEERNVISAALRRYREWSAGELMVDTGLVGSQQFHKTTIKTVDDLNRVLIETATVVISEP